VQHGKFYLTEFMTILKQLLLLFSTALVLAHTTTIAST